MIPKYPGSLRVYIIERSSRGVYLNEYKNIIALKIKGTKWNYYKTSPYSKNYKRATKVLSDWAHNYF